MRVNTRGSWLGVTVLVVIGLGLATGVEMALSQPPDSSALTPEPAAPGGQSFVGTKQCSSCHFDQFMTWKKSKHGKDAWESLPAKYRTDAKCVTCHTTGFGQETGFKSFEDTPNLVGVSCEACHGPGSKHVEVSKQFANKKKLSDEEVKAARDSIWKIVPHNVCVACHAEQNHKKHPTYDKAK